MDSAWPEFNPPREHRRPEADPATAPSASCNAAWQREKTRPVLVGCAVDAAPNTPGGDFTKLRPLPWFADGDAMKFG